MSNTLSWAADNALFRPEDSLTGGRSGNKTAGLQDGPRIPAVSLLISCWLPLTALVRHSHMDDPHVDANTGSQGCRRRKCVQLQANSRKPRRPCSAPAGAALVNPEYVLLSLAVVRLRGRYRDAALRTRAHIPLRNNRGELELPQRPGRPPLDRRKR